MPDFATIIEKGQPQGGTWFDWVMDGPDLESDDGLYTAIIISLFTDAQAAADDEIPDAPQPGTGGIVADRRGWWGDTVPAPQGTDRNQPDRIGSRLWLLTRASATTQTATLAKKYIQEALQWLIDDGVAQVVTVATKWDSPGNLAIGLLITRAGPNGVPVDHRYDLVWAMTGQVLDTPDVITLHGLLGDESGNLIIDEDQRPIEIN